NPFTRRFGKMISSDSGLDVALHFVQCHSDTFAVRIAHAFVTANESRNRDALWCAKSRVPAGSVLHCLNRLAVLIDILQRRPVLTDLLTSYRVSSVGEPLNLFFPDTPL